MKITISFISLILINVSMAEKDYKFHFAGNLKFFGLTLHTFASHWEYDLAIEKNGYVVAQIGAEAEFDFYLKKFFLLRLGTNLYKDCFNLWAGAYHAGFRVNLPIGESWEFRIGIGPTLIWRQNWWTHVDKYGGSNFYGLKRQSGMFEKAFLWWGGNAETEYRLWEKTSLVLTVIPAITVYTFSGGLRRHF